jgi:hypothetical protein
MLRKVQRYAPDGLLQFHYLLGLAVNRSDG